MPCTSKGQILYSLKSNRNEIGSQGSSPLPSIPPCSALPIPRVHVAGDRRGLGIRQLVLDSGVPHHRYRSAAPFTSGQPVPSVLDPLRRESFDSGVLRPAFRRPSLAATANRRLAVPAPSTTSFPRRLGCSGVISLSVVGACDLDEQATR